MLLPNMPLGSKKIAGIAAQYGWPKDHPAVMSIKPDGLAETQVHALLDPTSSYHVTYLDGEVPCVLTPFIQPHGGPTPASIATRHLDSGWHHAWAGVVIESRAVIFLAENGREMVRFADAGCGSEKLARNAMKLLTTLGAVIMNEVLDLSGPLMTLTMIAELSQDGLYYTTLRFERTLGQWIHAPI